MNTKKGHKRIKARIKGTDERPRVCVFRSNKHLFLQAIDDSESKTLASASDLKIDNPAGDLAKKLLAKKIKKIIFDRGRFRYHGKIKKMADELRNAGLEF